MIYLLVLIQVCLLVTGQTLWKIGIDKFGSITLQNIFKLLFTPYVFGGLIVYGIATILWLYIISIAKDKFSVVYPLGSLAYVLGVVIAMLIFKETIPYTRWIGVSLILLGAFFIAK